MKKSIQRILKLIPQRLALCSTIALAFIALPAQAHFIVQWRANPASEGVSAYYVWAALNTPGSPTNVYNAGTNLSVTVPLMFGSYKVQVVASNMWGLAVPSAPLFVPSPPTTPSGDRITTSGNLVVYGWNANPVAEAVLGYLPRWRNVGQTNWNLLPLTTNISVVLAFGKGAYDLSVMASNTWGTSAGSLGTRTLPIATMVTGITIVALPDVPTVPTSVAPLSAEPAIPLDTAPLPVQ